jgi:hypothetical protein
MHSGCGLGAAMIIISNYLGANLAIVVGMITQIA